MAIIRVGSFLAVVAFLASTTTAAAAAAAAAGDESSLSIPLHRRQANTARVNSHSSLRRRQSSVDPEFEVDFYWFANYTVGETHNLELLLDTGSTDLLVDPGKYKASPNSKPYANSTFSTEYEGINAQGTGFEIITGKIVQDIVTIGSVSAPQQPIGVIENYTVIDAPPKPSALMGDGLVGFGFTGGSAFDPQAPSWVEGLCISKLISQCRFGLAFGTNNKGVQVVGKVDKKLLKDELTTAPLVPDVPSWITRGDVEISGMQFKDQLLIFDSGTSNMQAPLEIAEQVYKKLGYNYTLSVGSSNVTFLTAYFPCNKPPHLSIGLPAEADIKNPPKGSIPFSKKQKQYSMFESEWNTQNNGHNNCTSVLAGTNAITIGNEEAWLIGQPFNQGHYMDFNFKGAIGIANLVDPKNVCGS